MIVESAFYKLPRATITTSQGVPKKDRTLYEAWLMSLFASLIRQEIASYNLPYPHTYVIENYPYTNDKSRKVDIYVDLYPEKGTSQVERALSYYIAPEKFLGCNLPDIYASTKSFIEVKMFLRIGLQKMNKQKNLGEILNDILRLKTLTGIERKERVNLYLLVLFGGHPARYLPYKSKKRNWVAELFIPYNAEFLVSKGFPYLPLCGTVEIPLEKIRKESSTIYGEISIPIDKKSLNISFIKHLVPPIFWENPTRKSILESWYFFLLRIL